MNTIRFDDNGQPSPWLNAGNRARRNASELIGLVRGIMADGTLKAIEVEALVQWLEATPESTASFPGNVLVKRLERYFEDKALDDDEMKDLAETLSQLAGGQGLKIKAMQASTTLPLTIPQPTLSFHAKEFVFTGRFFYGPRRVCEKAIVNLGGTCNAGPRGTTDYLIIGTIGSADWITSAYGTKIEKAMEMVRNGHRINIISEDHWAAHM
jgi:NAD-dependent DNA ligase